MLKLIILVLSFLLSFNSYNLFAKDVIQGSATGGINWSKGTVFASGYGVASDNTPNRKKRLLARRAAQVDAYRNLAEILSGVRISSETVVKDLEAESDIIRTKLNAIIKGALITKDIYQNEIAQVVIEVKMDGSFIETVSQQHKNLSRNVLPNALLPAAMTNVLAQLTDHASWSLFSRANATELPLVPDESSKNTIALLHELKTKINQQPKAEAIKFIDAKLASYENITQFSGLLIDAQNIDQFELATIPKLRTADGKIIYPTPAMLASNAFKKRPVSYDFDVSDAIENKRVAYTPYVVKALGTYKSRNSDLVVADEVALFIKNNNYIAKTLNKASVMIVIAK